MAVLDPGAMLGQILSLVLSKVHSLERVLAKLDSYKWSKTPTDVTAASSETELKILQKPTECCSSISRF